MPSITTQADSNPLFPTVLGFAHLLRRIGISAGPGSVVTAVEALQLLGLQQRDDIYWALHAVFVRRPEEHTLFDRAFHSLFGQTEFLAAGVDGMDQRSAYVEAPASRRVRDAMSGTSEQSSYNADIQLERSDNTPSWSARETLHTKDFEQMSDVEIREATAIVASMQLNMQQVTRRRYERSAIGEIDPRATFKALMRGSHGVVPLIYKHRQKRPPPLIVLCDISGSMERYSRMLLLLTHTLTKQRESVHSFVFGTRLTNITRWLKDKDIDRALAKVAANVQDWSGGTRIGKSLQRFNREWSRRILGPGAVVLLICDGLDRDAGKDLEQEMKCLHRSCRSLIWLNPLLRYKGFEPKTFGARAMINHVDEFRPAHNLQSLADLANILETRPQRKTLYRAEAN